MKKNIALVMGGFSGEHDISIASGRQVYEQLDHSRYNVYKIVVDRAGWYWECGDEHRPIDRGDFTVIDAGVTVHFDLAFIIVHGNPGENGVLQGYFDMLGIRYTTCGYYTSALTFHKGYCNPVVKNFGIVKVANSVLLYKEQWEVESGKWKDGIVPTDSPQSSLHLPVFVKPAAGGSSVATTKVKSPEALPAAIREAFTEDSAVLIEEAIVGREFDCGVFRNADGELLLFPITEIIPKGRHEFFDYAAKYEGFSSEVTPAEVDEHTAQHIQAVSAQLYERLGCKGIVRFDYILDSANNELYFLEVNTIPGQSAESIVPKQARAMGITPAQLYQMSIEAAMNK